MDNSMLGGVVGGALVWLHETNGTKFMTGRTLKSVNEKDGSAYSVTLDNGDIINANAVIMSQGVLPNTEFTDDSVKKDATGHLTCDTYMRTSDKNIWACGDVASHPWSFNGERMTVGHYSSSITSGSMAAFNMMNKFTPNTDVPTFWTKQFGKNVLFTGHGKKWDSVVVDGDLGKMDFIAYHIKDHRVEGCSAAGSRGMDAMLVNAAMKLNIVIKAHELYGGKLDMGKLREQINKKRPPCMCSRKANNEKPPCSSQA